MSTGRESPAGSEESDLASGKSRSVAPDDIFNNFPRNDEEVLEGMAETVPMPTPLPRSKLTEEDLQMTRLSRESIFPPRTQAEIARASAEIARRTEELREDLERSEPGRYQLYQSYSEERRDPGAASSFRRGFVPLYELPAATSVSQLSSKLCDLTV